MSKGAASLDSRWQSQPRNLWIFQHHEFVDGDAALSASAGLFKLNVKNGSWIKRPLHFSRSPKCPTDLVHLLLWLLLLTYISTEIGRRHLCFKSWNRAEDNKTIVILLRLFLYPPPNTISNLLHLPCVDVLTMGMCKRCCFVCYIARELLQDDPPLPLLPSSS